MPTKIPEFAGGRPTGGNQKDTRNFNIDLGDWLIGNKWQTLYIGADDADTTINYFLHTNQFLGTGSTDADITSTNFTKEIDLDFDIIIKSDRLIGGNTVATIKLGVEENGSSTARGYPIIRIKKNDVTLVSAQGSEITSTSTVATDKTYILKLIVPSTHFKVGDIFRITLEGWGKVDAGVDAGDDIRMFHDGTNHFIDLPFINLDEY